MLMLFGRVAIFLRVGRAGADVNDLASQVIHANGWDETHISESRPVVPGSNRRFFDFVWRKERAKLRSG